MGHRGSTSAVWQADACPEQWCRYLTDRDSTVHCSTTTLTRMGLQSALRDGSGYGTSRNPAAHPPRGEAQRGRAGPLLPSPRGVSVLRTRGFRSRSNTPGMQARANGVPAWGERSRRRPIRPLVCRGLLPSSPERHDRLTARKLACVAPHLPAFARTRRGARSRWKRYRTSVRTPRRWRTRAPGA
jgi:hypothetical protein